MSKIELPTITSGYNLSTINNNFQKIEDVLNEEVLYRKGYTGEPNEMQTNLDMNGKQILNVATGTSDGSLVTKGYVDQGLALKFDKSGGPISGTVDMSSNEILNVSRLSTNVLKVGGVQVVPTNLVVDPYNGTREALRRSYAEAGYNVVGDFTTGCTVTAGNQGVLYETAGTVYVWLGALPKTVPAGSTPQTTGGFGPAAWTDISDAALRTDLADDDGASIVGFIQSGTSATHRTAQDKMREIVSIKDFGVIGDGVIDDTSSFTAAVAYANSVGVKLVSPSGLRVKLTGAPVIEIKTSLDMNGSALNLEQFSGMITFKRALPVVTHGPGSSVVTALKTQATLYGNYFSGWKDIIEVDDAFIKIVSTQPWFNYRGAVVNRTEYNKITRYGVAESELRYPLTSSLVDSVVVYPVEKVKKVVENIVFELGSNDIANGFVTIETSLFEAKNWTFSQNNFANATKNQTLITINNSCHIELDGIYFKWPCRTAENGYTYNLSMGDSYDVVINNMHGIGDGWGATGSNSCQRIEFKNSSVSRIDFHRPFIEYLKVRNCKIGNWGVLVTALGDLRIDDSEFLLTGMPYIDNAGYIRSRDDTGGFCDGDLVINNSRFSDTTTSSTRVLAVHGGDPAQIKPSGSTINYRFWKTITINNISSKNSNLNLMPDVRAFMPYPEEINVVNCTSSYGGFVFSRDMSLMIPFRTLGVAQTSATSNRPNLIINIVNSSISNFNLADSGAIDFVVSANFTNVIVSDYSRRSMEFEATASGVYTLIGCQIEGLDFYSAGDANGPINVIFSSGVIRHTGAYNTNVVTGALAPKVRLSISDSDVSTTTGASLNTLLQAKLSGNTYRVGTGAGSYRIVCSSDLQSGTGGLVVANVNTANNYILQTGFPGDGSAKDHRIVMPDPGFSFYVPVSSTSGVSVKRETNGTSLTVTSTGVVVARTVQLT